VAREEHRSFCRLCGAACGILVTTEGTRVVEIRGDAENPLTEGYLCGKGRTLGIVHHDPRRFDRALLGRPPTRVEVGLAEALDGLGAKLRRIMAESGRDAIGLYMGTQAFLESGAIGPVLRFASALGSRSFYSAVTVDTIAMMVAGIKLTGGLHTVMPDVDHARARFLLVLGHNPVVSHALWPNPVVKLRRIMARGEVWVVDPRRTETAKIATRHLQIRAGTDVFLAAHLVRELLRSGADEAYLRDHATGVDTLRDALEPYTLDVTAARVGVPTADLVELVQAIRRFGTIAVSTGTGPRMGPQPSTTMWLMFVLSIITGSLDRPGGSIVLGRGLRAGPADSPAEGPGPRSRPELTTWAGQYPCAALADEIEAGNLRALISFGGNPASAIPGHVRLGAALRSLEVFAVHDIVPTLSTDLATHVLPGTSELEHASLAGGTTPDGRHFTQFAPAILSPIADRKPTWWYVNEIAQRLGLSVFDEQFTEDEVHAGGKRGRVVEHARSAPAGIVVGDDVHFGTLVDDLPEGRWNLAPREFVDQLRQATHMPKLVLIPHRQPRHVNSFLVDVPGPAGKLDSAELLMHPDDASEAGVTDGARAVVTSSTGQLTLRARVTEDISRGAVSIPHGYSDANVNVLTSATDRVDPISGMPLQGGVAVAVHCETPSDG
jgi:anaerobic selenocysteine-containing dehydrogenase